MKIYKIGVTKDTEILRREKGYKYNTIIPCEELHQYYVSETVFKSYFINKEHALSVLEEKIKEFEKKYDTCFDELYPGIYYDDIEEDDEDQYFESRYIDMDEHHNFYRFIIYIMKIDVI